jgi:hypothetical protein
MDKFRKCPCGKEITGKRVLCPECRNIYGDDRGEWPSWLLFMVNDFHTEYRKEVEYQDSVSGFSDDAEDGDEEELYQDESYVDSDGLIMLRGCRNDAYALNQETYFPDGTLKERIEFCKE